VVAEQVKVGAVGAAGAAAGEGGLVELSIKEGFGLFWLVLTALVALEHCCCVCQELGDEGACGEVLGRYGHLWEIIWNPQPLPA
jgi:hypothetical protein